MQIIEIHTMLIEPFPVRQPLANYPFQFIITDNLFKIHICDEHPAGLQSAFENDFSLIDRKCSCLRSHDQGIVLHQAIPGRTKAISIEGGTDEDTVGEAYG